VQYIVDALEENNITSFKPVKTGRKRKNIPRAVNKKKNKATNQT
jgi:hypothetical protein